jgi:hypothetical protein
MHTRGTRLGVLRGRGSGGILCVALCRVVLVGGGFGSASVHVFMIKNIYKV